MKEPALVIIKPDGVSKGLVGNILTKFNHTGLEIVALRIALATRNLAEEHYRHIKGTPFFDGVIRYIMGDFHKEKKLIAVIFYGNNAIKKCRRIAGATNPEDASPHSIRGSYGRILRNGVFENVVHVSSDRNEAKREIQLWFKPGYITVNLYPSKEKMIKAHKERVWK